MSKTFRHKLCHFQRKSLTFLRLCDENDITPQTFDWHPANIFIKSAKTLAIFIIIIFGHSLGHFQHGYQVCIDFVIIMV
jgi:hypothetical protein